MNRDGNGWHFSEARQVTGAGLAAELQRCLAAGHIRRLQLLSPRGDLTLVLPLAGNAIDPRWLPVVATLARNYDTLTLRLARATPATGTAPREAVPASAG